jgi:hypothetical protein
MMNHANARRTYSVLTAVALAASFLISGCGGGGDSMESADTSAEAVPDAPPRADLCALLSATDIEEALGTAAGDPQPGDQGLGHCEWAAADGSGSAVVLELDNSVLSSFDAFVTDFGEEFGGENPPPDEYHPVDGVPGDWAMFVAEEHMVRAFRGDHVLKVSSPGADEAQVVDLATRAMGRLP